MLGMLRRARKRREERERNCPCGGTCDCHKPAPDMPSWLVIILFSSLAIISVVAIVFPPKHERRTIYVGTKLCDVVFVVTGRKCNGHGGECHDVGYDQAVCP